jgi:tetratricopeptide (TPR) repeat protein
MLKSLIFIIALGLTQGGYDQWFARAEAAKRRGDMEAMERSLLQALNYGPGDEYAWRSLAWAQMRQGKWQESLANARENIRRNGETSWSLLQLHESAMAAGDVNLARQALARETQLNARQRNTDTRPAWRLFRQATQPTAYELEWRLKVSQYRIQGGELVLLSPLRKHSWQSAEVSVAGAHSYRIEHVDGKDILFIKPGSEQHIIVQAKIIHHPQVRGGIFLSRLTSDPPPPEYSSYLGPFRNRAVYEVGHPEIKRIASTLVGRNSAEQAQAVLDWLGANMKYEGGHSDELDSILRSRRGVCHHYSNLAVTLLRAKGIPAVVAHGVLLPPGDTELRDIEASHGWVEAYLAGIGWTALEPLDRNSLRSFRSGYLVFNTSGRGIDDDHFVLSTHDGRRIESFQDEKVNGKGRLLASD